MTWDVILNPRAGRLGDGSSLRKTLTDACNGAEVHTTGNAEELAAVAERLRRRGSRAIALAGGDGSTMAGVSALAKAFGGTPPPIALVGGGTVGTIAAAIDPRSVGRDWGAQLLRAISEGTAVEQEHGTLSVHANEPDMSRVGFIFGGGLISNFFGLYDALPAQGTWAAAALAARVFASSWRGGALSQKVLTPVPAHVIVDGVPTAPAAWSLIATSVLANLGLGMKLTYRAAEDRDRLHVVASALGPARLAPQVHRVLRGQRLTGAGHVDQLASTLTVRFGPRGGSFVLDGDRFQAQEVTVVPGPKVVFLSLRPTRVR